ncbi:MAG: AMP-binding protein, partial [Paracoccaceae bacterium]
MDVFTWHPQAVLYTPEGKPIAAKDHLEGQPNNIHPLTAFFTSLKAGQSPYVKNDGAIVNGPKTPFENMFYSASGGSTGEPKLVCRSCKSWLLSFQENKNLLNISQKKTYATLGHLSHSLTLYAALEALTIGANFYPLGGMSVAQQLKQIAQQRIQILYATPTQLRLLTKSASLERPLMAVEGIMIGGGWLDYETKKLVQELCS